MEIPANRKLTIDLPPDVPEGAAVITLSFANAEPACVGTSPCQLKPHRDGVSVEEYLAICRENERLGPVPISDRPQEDDEEFYPFLRYMGCHKGVPGGSVDEFLTQCREDKEYELALEERRWKESNRYAEKLPF
jgi:hypothetical protein